MTELPYNEPESKGPGEMGILMDTMFRRYRCKNGRKLPVIKFDGAYRDLIPNGAKFSNKCNATYRLPVDPNDEWGPDVVIYKAGNEIVLPGFNEYSGLAYEAMLNGSINKLIEFYHITIDTKLGKLLKNDPEKYSYHYADDKEEQLYRMHRYKTVQINPGLPALITMMHNKNWMTLL